MFNLELNPSDVLNYVFRDMKKVLYEMRNEGVDIRSTPPHCSSIYLLLSEKDPTQVGLCRGEPTVLTEFDKCDWGGVGLNSLHKDSSAERVAIGTFIGFIDCLRHTKTQSPLDSYVGVLICPIGVEAVGCMSALKNLESIKGITTDIFEQFPYLQSNCIFAESETAH